MRRYVFATGMALLGLVVTASAQAPVSTAFTYQGRLEDGGNPVNVPYDMIFRLYDAAGGGLQVGSNVTVNDAPVADGLFTVSLDFGSPAFTGNARWLDIQVRLGTSAGAYTLLTPRQPLTATPYALYALNSPTSGSPWSPNGTHIFNTNTGDVGIGTSVPQRLLHTVGDAVLFERAVNDSAVILRNTLNGTLNTSFGLHNTALNDGYSYLSDQTQTPLLYLTDGNVGIGTATPAYRLDVNGRVQVRQGSTSSAGIYFHQTTPNEECGFVGMRNDTQIGLYGTQGAGWGMVMDVVNGQVGIGTTSPNGKLDVTTAVAGETAINGLVTANSGKAGFFSNDLNANFSGDTLTAWCFGNANSQAFVASHFGTGDCAVFEITSATNGGEAVEVITNGTGQAILSTSTGTGQAGYFRILNPDSNATALYCATNGTGLAFQANGTARVDVLEITGADLAEKFPVSDAVKPEPGMVVMIDAANAGKLCLASGAYNKRVAGVISGANNLPAGTILGNLPGNEDAPPVALSGRVWVHCDATTQAIEPGDMLTTSATPGHAMVASDGARSHGAVIGKAMTELQQGEKGMVLVLVNLQ